MRDPSIHITESQLIIILENLPDFLIKKNRVKSIMIQARRVSCDNRVISISNEKLKRQATIITKAGKGDSNLVATLLYSIRKKKKHVGIKRLKEGDRDWGRIKELTNLCIEFCNDFNLGKREGIITYINTGIIKTTSSKNLLNKLIMMYESIALEHEAQIIIDNDESEYETISIQNLYLDTIEQRTGLVYNHDKNALDYICFIKVREITDKYNIPANIYIDAQFDGLQWTQGYPTPLQLCSDRAIDRLNKYLFKKKIKVKTQSKNVENKDIVSILKKIKDEDNYND